MSDLELITHEEDKEYFFLIDGMMVCLLYKIEDKHIPTLWALYFGPGEQELFFNKFEEAKARAIALLRF